MIVIQNDSTDAYYNLALEEYVFTHMDASHVYFWLWQNDRAVIIGRHQNAVEEIDREYVKQHRIKVVRRLSGGGAVYHDLGNLNFTFIADKAQHGGFDFSRFATPVAQALRHMGVPAELSGRNDLTIEGRKFSGNAGYDRHGRMMHHGTLLFSSDLSVLSQTLRVKPQKIESKGIRSVRSRVTNISEYLPNTTLAEFREQLLAKLFAHETPTFYTPGADDVRRIEALAAEKYAAWEWNYGHSPQYTHRKEASFAGGHISALLDIKEGRIASLRFSGDFFGNGELSALASVFTDLPLREDALRTALRDVDVGYYINGLTANELTALLTE